MSDRVIRSYTEMLGLLSRGDFSRRLDQELTKLIETLEALPTESGKATITVGVEFKYELGRIDINPTFKVKLPETDRFMKTPFWTIEGALSVQHPSQLDIFSGPRTVEGEAKAISA
jgi:hypothetical protein